MATVIYTPRGSGCTVQLTAPGSRELTLARASLADDEPEVLSGHVDLRANVALVTVLDDYAANELAYRRTRSPEKRKSYQQASEQNRKDGIAIADMIIRSGGRTLTGWCSGCFENTEHRHVRGHDRPRRKYLCLNCGTPTTKCGVPGCRHLAVVNPRALSTLRYCAEHRHEIPRFETLDDHLETLADWKDWLQFRSRNASRITKVAGGSIGSAAVLAPLALLAAPAVGAALGSSALGGGLSGAAASSHGLAMLGGGSVASGGLGMFGGTAVVAATGSALGGALGATTTAAYVGADKSFRIERVRSGSGPVVVFATGFLTEGLAGWDAWRLMIDARFSGSTVYQVHWGARELQDLGTLVASGGAKVAVRRVLVSRAKKGSKAFGALPGIGMVLAARDLGSNPWTIAKVRAGMTGAAVADLISRTDEGPFVLLGHSLGARVMVAAAQALGTRPGAPRVDSVHLLGAAVDREDDWRTLAHAVSGAVWNYYSSNDQVLRWLYMLAERGKTAAGYAGLRSKFSSVRDRNVSRSVRDHSGYVMNVVLQN